MASPDLNLLVALDILLSEGSVARAAHRLRLSPSATSRTLARLRRATGDPLLVRAGRALVPTPYAVGLRDRIAPLVRDAQAALRPAQTVSLKDVVRTLTVRTSDGFVENFGPDLVRRVARQAPGVRLRFLPKPDRDAAPLREGAVDFEIGVIGQETAPEMRSRTLFRDRFVGAVRKGHALTKGKVTPARYAAGSHVLVSRKGRDRGVMDDALDALGLKRHIVTIVGDFSAALAIARASDLIASVPERHTENLRVGMSAFAIPLQTPEFTVSLLWHPRSEAEPVHRWVRQCINETCAAPDGKPRPGAARSEPSL